MWLDETLFNLPECGPAEGLVPGMPGPRWRHLGVDQVGSFTADHLACGDADGTWTVDGNEYGCGCAGMEFWIDRVTHLIVRQLIPGEGDGPIEVREVVDLRFAGSPDEIFRPPDGAVIRAVIPQAELHGFATELQSMTHGYGGLRQRFHGYAEAPPEVAAKVAAENQKEHAVA